MNTTDGATPPDDCGRDVETGDVETGASRADDSAPTEGTPTPRRSLNKKALVPLGIGATVVVVLLSNPEVRKVCSSVMHDPKVQQACRKAGDEIASSWRLHDGPAVLARALFL